LNYFLA